MRGKKPIKTPNPRAGPTRGAWTALGGWEGNRESPGKEGGRERTKGRVTGWESEERKSKQGRRTKGRKSERGKGSGSAGRALSALAAAREDTRVPSLLSTGLGEEPMAMRLPHDGAPFTGSLPLSGIPPWLLPTLGPGQSQAVSLCSVWQ